MQLYAQISLKSKKIQYWRPVEWTNPRSYESVKVSPGTFLLITHDFTCKWLSPFFQRLEMMLTFFLIIKAVGLYEI